MPEPASEYPILFSPLGVGPITLRDRIVNAAHQTGFADHGGFTEQIGDQGARHHHAVAAAGGKAGPDGRPDHPVYSPWLPGW